MSARPGFCRRFIEVRSAQEASTRMPEYDATLRETGSWETGRVWPRSEVCGNAGRARRIMRRAFIRSKEGNYLATNAHEWTRISRTPYLCLFVFIRVHSWPYSFVHFQQFV